MIKLGKTYLTKSGFTVTIINENMSSEKAHEQFEGLVHKGTQVHWIELDQYGNCYKEMQYSVVSNRADKLMDMLPKRVEQFTAQKGVTIDMQNAYTAGYFMGFRDGSES